MLRFFYRAKIHRARVTEARLDYAGSITVDAGLLAAAGILPHEMVQITNLENGTRWRTYAMAAPAGSGMICLNGPPARWFQPGDRVIILCEALLEPGDIAGHRARMVFVDDANHVVQVEEHLLEA